MEPRDFDEAFFADFMEKERVKLREIRGRELRKRSRESYRLFASRLRAIEVIPGGFAASTDQPFAATGTLTPSNLIDIQIHLAATYIKHADSEERPSLSSFVILRVAIECLATAFWIMDAKSKRQAVERTLKRIWWDTANAESMAKTADPSFTSHVLDEVGELILRIAGPMKRLDADAIKTSARVSLSRLVDEASRAINPTDPGELFSTWKACAGISHGNIPISAGVGVSAQLIRMPAAHAIDEPAYAHMLWVISSSLDHVISMAEERASRQQAQTGAASS